MIEWAAQVGLEFLINEGTILGFFSSHPIQMSIYTIAVFALGAAAGYKLRHGMQRSSDGGKEDNTPNRLSKREMQEVFDGMTNAEKHALRKIAESGGPALVSESGIDEYVLGSLADKGAVVNLSEGNNHAISGWHRVSIDGRWLEFVRKNWNLMP